MIKTLPKNFPLPSRDGQTPDEDLNLLDFREPVREKGQVSHWAMIFSLIALHGGLIAYLVGFTRISDPSEGEMAPRAIPVEIATSRRHDTPPKEDLEITRRAPMVRSAQTLTDIAVDERVPPSALPVITRSVKLAQARIGVLPEDGGRVVEAPPSGSEAGGVRQQQEAAQAVERRPNAAASVQVLPEKLPEDASLVVTSPVPASRMAEDTQLPGTETADGLAEDPVTVEMLQAREVTARNVSAGISDDKTQPVEAERASPVQAGSESADTGLKAGLTGERSPETSLGSTPEDNPMPSDRATDSAREFRTVEPPTPSPQLQEAADRYGQILASQEDTRWPEDLGKADGADPTASVRPETEPGSYKPTPAIMSGKREDARSLPLEAPLPERRTAYANEIAGREARERHATKPGESATTRSRSSRRQLLDDYRSEVRNHLASYRPPGGFGTDTVVVGFTLTRSGDVTSARILKSRGIYHLEQGTLNAVNRAAPFPLPPGDLSGARFHFAIPFRFE